MSNQTVATPPGFYPAENGRQRYWDGEAWTDRYGDQGSATVSTAPGGAKPEKKSPGRLRRWLPLGITALMALFIGVAIGAGGSGKAAPKTGAAPAPTVTATATVSVTAPPVTVTAPPVTVTPPAVTIAPPPPPPPAAGTSVQDGVYVVGQDMQPGTYRVTAAVGADCYWKITKSGTNGSDIVENDIPGGGFPQVTLTVGQDFNSTSCGTWVRK